MSSVIEEITAEDGQSFRKWLEHNHTTATAVWLIFWRKGSQNLSIEWGEAVDRALCFGWIDSKVQSLDSERYRQYFSVRRPGSGWSRLNKDKIAELEKAGLIAPAGFEVVARAKADGSWRMLDGVQDAYDNLTIGARKAILAWLVTAKRDETRSKRIARAIASLREGRSPLG